MPGRPQLSEEAEREEAEDREKFYAAEAKLRELRRRRSALVDEVHQLSDLQRQLYETRLPLQEKVEAAHAEHRAIGHDLNELRRRRDEARARMDDALAALRSFQPVGGRGEHLRPEQIRREIRQLEIRQQTTALPLAEENALIDRLRELSRELATAEKNRVQVEEHERRRHELEEALRLRRAEFEKTGEEGAHLRAERDRRMASMQAHLVEVGRLLGEMREKTRARGEAMARLDALQRDIVGLEREMDRLVGRSRERRHEARETLRAHSSRPPAGGRDVEGAYARSAEAQLEELLKRGRVTLGG